MTDEGVITTSTSSPSAVRELALDVGLPLGLYFGLRAGAGVSLVTALAVSSVPPALRTGLRLIRDGEINGLALLMVVVNVAGIAASFITGDARLLLVRNSAISSVIAVALFVSAFRGRPLMSAGLRAFLAKEGERAAVWERLSVGSPEFATLERRYTLAWAMCLAADCAARLAGALTLPVSTMAWASDLIVALAILLAIVVSGIVATGRIIELLDAGLGDRGATTLRGTVPV